MPKGPKGEKRHADTVQNAMLIGRIATGDVEDVPSKAPNRSKGGKAGGKAGLRPYPQKSAQRSQKKPPPSAGADSALVVISDVLYRLPWRSLRQGDSRWPPLMAIQ